MEKAKQGATAKPTPPPAAVAQNVPAPGAGKKKRNRKRGKKNKGAQGQQQQSGQPQSQPSSRVRAKSSPASLQVGFPSKEERRLHKRHLRLLVALVVLALGVVLGYYIAYTPPQKILAQMQSWREQIEVLTGQPLPQPLLNMLEQLNITTSSVMSELIDTDENRPGLRLRREGVKAKYPVVLLPGFITTQLELWDGHPCASGAFHQTLWGGLTMIAQLIRNVTCWAEHMALDPTTGLDPEGIKLRPVDALHGLDYLFPGYWVWGRLVLNLADVGYDSRSLFAATFDWRIAPSLTEARDGFMTRLKAQVETAHRLNGEKVVLIAHSMSGPITLTFLQWAEAQQAGWVQAHIHSYVNIGGALLGAPKAVPALLSGEMKDTAENNLVRGYIVDKFLSPLQRRDLIRSWTSLGNLLPKGGDAFWGPILHLGNTSLSASKSLAFLFERLDETPEGKGVANNLRKFYSLDAPSKTPRKVQERDWTNPLVAPLPSAPSMTLYCLYGYNKPTETGYVYRDQEEDTVDEWLAPDLPGIRFAINGARSDRGVLFSEGDGTVPLVSLGYMCQGGWQTAALNPGRVRIVTREYQHRDAAWLLRGGSHTGDHVDILGNAELLQDVLSIVTGREQSVQNDVIISNITKISRDINSKLGLL